MLPKNLFLAAGLCLLVCAVLFLGFLEEDEFESPTIPALPISLIQNGNWSNPAAPAMQPQSFAALEGHLPSDVISHELPRPIAATDYAPNIGGAGGTVSNAQDVASFWRAVMSGQLVSGQTLNQGQSQAHTFFGNNTMMMGAGLITHVGSQNHGFWFGHGGGSTQVDALLDYSPSKKLIIAIAGIGQKVSAFDILNAIVQTLEAE